MKLHWSAKSPFVRKVTVAAHELGLWDRIELVRTVAAMSTPNLALMADNPLSKLPTLVLDDGRAIFDSSVICEYLDSVAGGDRLFPKGPERWEALVWQALGGGLMDALVLWRNERDKPEAHQTEAWIRAFEVKTVAALDRLESDVGRLSAARFGIGHITIGCALSYADFRFPQVDWRRGRPGLTAWHETFSARPSMIATEIPSD